MVLVLAGVGFFGYNYLTRTIVPSDVLLQQTTGNTSKMGAEVLSALNQLRVLQLDGSVFSDKTFLSLQDFSKPLNSEPVGRINPFSPIGVESFIPGKTATVSTSTSTFTATSTGKTGPTSTSTNKTPTVPITTGTGN